MKFSPIATPPLSKGSRFLATSLATLALAFFSQGQSCGGAPVINITNQNCNSNGNSGDCGMSATSNTGFGATPTDQYGYPDLGTGDDWLGDGVINCFSHEECQIAYADDPCNDWYCGAGGTCVANMYSVNGEIPCDAPADLADLTECLYFGCKLASSGISPIRSLCLPAEVYGGTCYIDGACFEDNDLNPDSSCERCDASDEGNPIGLAGTWRTWTPLDDGLVCNVGEDLGVCAEGLCEIDTGDTDTGDTDTTGGTSDDDDSTETTGDTDTGDDSTETTGDTDTGDDTDTTGGTSDDDDDSTETTGDTDTGDTDTGDTETTGS